jgi:hypothetical protein
MKNQELNRDYIRLRINRYNRTHGYIGDLTFNPEDHDALILMYMGTSEYNREENTIFNANILYDNRVRKGTVFFGIR